MKKLSLISSVLLLIAASVGAQDAIQPETPQNHRPFSVNVDLVELHVAVVDGAGRPVGGLGQQNFKVKENNILQPITVFKHEDRPVSLGLVVDNSRSIEPRKARLDAAALSFVDRSNPDDETFIIHFDSEVKLSRSFTHDRSSLHREQAGAKPFGETALYDAIMLGLDTMDEARYSKKALLVITDGIDNRSKTTLEQIVARASREDVMIFPVGLLSQSGGLKAEDSLISIAEATGGRAYFPQTPEEARIMIDLIAKDLREQYTIAYLPTNVLRDGRWRSVRVELDPPKGYPKDLQMNYRHGYYAPDAP
jgi:Ca-activated chloride channel family protein